MQHLCKRLDADESLPYRILGSYCLNTTSPLNFAALQISALFLVKQSFVTPDLTDLATFLSRTQPQMQFTFPFSS